jgi:iron complex transport system substrate-binding protein
MPVRRAMIGVLGLAAVMFAAAGTPVHAGGSKPQRIVSLNLCVDQLLLDVVARERIAGLSFLAADPSMSAMHEAAKDIPALGNSAEEILALDPDLILAGEYSTPATVDLLRRLGRRVVTVPMASSFEDIRTAVRVVAEATGDGEKGGAVIAAFDQRLTGVQSRLVGPRRTAVAMQVNSLTSGPGSLVDEVLDAAGYENVARTAKLGRGGQMPLERLVASPPDLIVMANAGDDFRTVLGDNLRHPSFQRLTDRQMSIHLPMSKWLCGTPRIVEAVEDLQALSPKLAARQRLQ